MTIKTISTKGRVNIPKELRDKYHLEPGDKVDFVDYGGVISIVRISDGSMEDDGGSQKAKKDKKLEK